MVYNDSNASHSYMYVVLHKAIQNPVVVRRRNPNDRKKEEQNRRKRLSSRREIRHSRHGEAGREVVRFPSPGVLFLVVFAAFLTRFHRRRLSMRSPARKKAAEWGNSEPAPCDRRSIHSFMNLRMLNGAKANPCPVTGGPFIHS